MYFKILIRVQVSYAIIIFGDWMPTSNTLSLGSLTGLSEKLVTSIRNTTYYQPSCISNATSNLFVDFSLRIHSMLISLFQELSSSTGDSVSAEILNDFATQMVICPCISKRRPVWRYIYYLRLVSVPVQDWCRCRMNHHRIFVHGKIPLMRCLIYVVTNKMSTAGFQILRKKHL